jgi:tetratricopeptide (TPR) repeat protein
MINALRVALFCACVQVAGEPAVAQQSGSAADASSVSNREQELDALFATLRDKSSDAAASRAEQLIWSLWMKSDLAENEQRLAAATNAMGGGDFRLAEEILTKLVASQPAYSEAWNKRATLYYLMGKYDESLSDIVKTLDIEPRHFGALSGRGMILMKQGKMKEALAAYREAQAINPHMPGVAAAVQQLETLMPEL